MINSRNQFEWHVMENVHLADHDPEHVHHQQLEYTEHFQLK